jgi:hypothetical protein
LEYIKVTSAVTDWSNFSWVFSNLLPSSEKTGHGIYTVTASKKITGDTWDISYGDGSGAKGVVYADKVVIGTCFLRLNPQPY